MLYPFLAVFIGIGFIKSQLFKENIKFCMSSTCRQRFFEEERENNIKIKPFGQVRMMQVCLDYKGTQSELHCIKDGENLKKVALQSGVKEILSIYDDFSTPIYPSKEGVLTALVGQLQKCNPGDYFIFQYSGHGTHVDDENGDEEDGQDEAFCLRTKDGEDQTLIDDDIAEVVSKFLHPKVPALFIVDACHSGTILDLQKGGIWGGKHVFLISGCQDQQTSGDTEDGGHCTLALLKALQNKNTNNLRRKRGASIQFVFNRMVENMPEQEEQIEEGDNEQEMEEGDWGNNWNQEDFNQGWEDEEECEDEDEEPEDDEPMEGQWLNLSWNGGTDPTHVPFPF